MQCSCGGMTKTMSHEIKTSTAKIEWMGFDGWSMPVRVDRNVCGSCGRQDKPRFYDAATGVRLTIKNK